MQLVVIAALLPLAAGHGSARAETAAAHNDITVVDLCDDPALDACSSSDRALNFPTVSSTPTYSWNVNATLMSDVTTPTFDVVVAFQENLPAPFHYQIPLGRSSGAACGVVQVPFGVGAKGDRSPLPCPGCHIALTFPACPSGWKKEAPLLVEGVFKMGFFLIPGYEPTPNITVNVTVRAGNGGRIFDLTSHQRPSRKPETATVLSSNKAHQANDADLSSVLGFVGDMNKVVHADITAIDLCKEEANDPCSASGRMLNFPTVTMTPTYSWNVTATLPSDIAAPTYEVVVAVDEMLPKRFDYNLTWGRGSGPACGEVKVPFGRGSKGDREPMPCPGCHIALTFPACPWKKEAPLLVEGVFKAGFFYFEILTVPNITVDVTVRGNEGRVIALRSLAHPKREKDSMIVV